MLRPRFLRGLVWAVPAVGWMAVPLSFAYDPNEGDYDWGFLASRLEDVHGDIRVRAAGPFYESAESGAGETLVAFRPFYSRYADAAAERTNFEIAWPICTAKRFKDEFAWRFLSAYSLDFDTTDPLSARRLVVFPFYVQGRAADGDTYLAVFPFGGRVRNFLGQDEISFVLFPLRMKSSLNGIDSRHVMWPIYSRTSGKGIYRFRIFPFYAKSSMRDNFNKKAILWPFWTSAEYTYPNSYGKGYIFFPFWGHIELSDEESWIFLPPFFRVTKSDTLTTKNLPYPFLQFSSGETEKSYIWPIWGKKTMPGSHRTFFLWPIFHRLHVDRSDGVLYRFLALPFFYRDARWNRAEDGVSKGEMVEHYWKFWPLVSWERRGEESRLRALELWPLRRTGPIERNFAPFWTLYSRTALDDSIQSEWLWGLVRHHRDGEVERYFSLFPLVQYHRTGDPAETRQVSFLKGLFEYRREGEERGWRLLYFLRLGDKEAFR